jgi:hypothetical protein
MPHCLGFNRFGIIFGQRQLHFSSSDNKDDMYYSELIMV